MFLKKINLKSILSISITSLIVFGLINSNISYASDSIKKVEIIRVLKIDVDESQMDEELFRLYTDDGWTYDGDSFTTEVKYQDEVIKVNNEEIILNEDGYFYIEDANINSIEYKEDGVNYIDYKVDFNSNNSITIKSTISINDLISGMIESEQQNLKIGQANGEKPKVGDIVACNRFNGYQGNNTYYSNELSSQAQKNFKYSDCYWAR